MRLIVLLFSLFESESRPRKNKSAWWIFTQLYFRGGESWPNYFGKEVNCWKGEQRWRLEVGRFKMPFDVCIKSKISVNSNFTFSNYAWLCVFHCSHRLLCWIKSRVRDFSVKIALISYWNDFSPTPLGKCASYRSAPQICKIFTFYKFWERPLFDISEYDFNHWNHFNLSGISSK